MTNHLNLEQWKTIFLDHIFSDIRWAIDSKRNLAAAQLILSAVDIIAGVDRPLEKEDTTGEIFIRWCDEHMAISGTDHKLTGLDLWGARCGFLHGYTPLAKVVREGRARMLIYVDEAENPVMGSTETPEQAADSHEQTSDTPELLIVSLRSLFGSLVDGANASMKRANNDAEIGNIVNQRMSMMFHSIDISDRFANL
jgi:hypothetical protein